MANNKPHLISSDLPSAIFGRYSQLEYSNLKAEGLCDSPIPQVYLTILQSSNVNLFDLRIHFKEYDRGFMKGYSSRFIPHIDSIRTRKEMVMKAINEEQGFSKTITHFVSINTEADFYKAGKAEGKRYKAWEIVFETPMAFMSYFEQAEQAEPKAMQRLPVIKPIFRQESIPEIFGLLKDFFTPQQQPLLEELLKTGNDASEPLIFLDNGCRIADAFKKLIETDFITGCQKKELENWIGRNFNYKYQDKNQPFKPRYLNDIISTTKDKCKKPILFVINDKATSKAILIKV
jgi:hypothetical protein